jgi:hypothetical protein
LAGVDGVDAVVVQADGRDLADGVLEQFVTAQEVGFGVHFDGGGGHAGAFVAHGDADEAFGGDAVGLLGGLGQALGAQPVDGRVDVAVVFDEGLLAVHHADAGLFAQFFHQRSGHFSHEILH